MALLKELVSRRNRRAQVKVRTGQVLTTNFGQVYSRIVAGDTVSGWPVLKLITAAKSSIPSFDSWAATDPMSTVATGAM
jgi:hypothetical protein